MKPKQIFSGKDSEMLWTQIGMFHTLDRENHKTVEHLAYLAGTVIYNLGCHCQMLETRVDALTAEVAKLKAKK